MSKTAAKNLCSTMMKLERSNYQINEAKEDLPEGITAIVRGPMAKLEGMSLNGRWYNPKIWESGLKSCENRLNDSGLFGTCGHKVPLDEQALFEAKLTHKVVKLWINEDNGTIDGEIHLFERAGGENLAFYMRQGYPLAVSTRAYGNVLRGKGPNGSDLIDESTFYLETIDFVVNPGVPEARPSIVEDLQEDKEKFAMDLMESFNQVNKEKVDLQVELKTSLNENVDLKAKLEAQTKLLESVQAENKQLNEGLRKWTEMEPFKSLAAKTHLHDQSMGSSAEIMSNVNEALVEYTKLGPSAEVAQKLSDHAKYAELGSVDEMVSAKELLRQFAKYKKKPSELNEAFEKAEKVNKIYESAKRKLIVEKTAKKFKIEESVVQEMMESAPADKVVQMLKKMKPAAPAPAQKKELNESAPAKPAAPAKPEPIPTVKKGNGAVVDSIFESLNNSVKGWIPTPVPNRK